ncbi:MAG: hypothetical protein ACFFB5_18360 [Promethearchaeota archaeon]
MPLDPLQKNNDSKESDEVLKLGVTLTFGLLLAFLVGNLSFEIIGIEVLYLIPSDFIIFFQNIIEDPHFIPIVIFCFCYSLNLTLRGSWFLIENFSPRKGSSFISIPLSYKEKLPKFLDICLLISIFFLGILYVITNMENINIGLASPFALFFLLVIFLSLDIFFDSDRSYKRYGNPTARWTLAVNRVLSNYRRRLISFLQEDFENDREIPFFFFFIVLLIILQVHIFLVFFFIGSFIILRLYFQNRSVPNQLYQFSMTLERGYIADQFGSLKAGIIGIIVSSTLFIVVYSKNYIDPFTPIFTAFYHNWITFCLVLAVTWISWAYKRYLTILVGVCLCLMVITFDIIITGILLISTISIFIIGVIIRIYEIREPDIETNRLQEEISRILKEKTRFNLNELRYELELPKNVDIKRMIHKVVPDIQKILDFHKYPTFVTPTWLNSFDDLLLETVQTKGSFTLNNLAKELDVNLKWLRDYINQKSDEIKGILVTHTFKGTAILITPEWLRSFKNNLIEYIRKEQAIKLSKLAKKLDVKIRWLKNLIEKDTGIIKNSIILLNIGNVNNPLVVDRQLGPVIRINDLADIINANPELMKRELIKKERNGTIIKDSDLFITAESLKLDQELGDLARDIKKGNAIPYKRLEGSLDNILDGIRFARHFTLDTGLVLTQMKNRFYLAERFQAYCQLKNEEITSNLTFYQCKQCFKYLCQSCHKSLELTRMLNCPSCGNKDLQELPLTCPQCLITVVSIEEIEENLLCQLCGITYLPTAEVPTHSIKEYASLRRIDKIEKMLLKGEFIPYKNDMSYISVRQVLRHRLHNKTQFLIQSNKSFKAQSLEETCQICQNQYNNSMEFYYCTNCNRPVCSSCFSSKKTCPYCTGSLVKYPKECIKCQVDFIRPNQIQRENTCPFCQGKLTS